jgi:hypothetical protein
MGQLAEYLKNEQQQHEGKYPNRVRDATEWKTALTQLFDQLESWIREADPDRRMRVTRDNVTRYEPRLGYCELPRLKMQFEGSEITFQPGGRYAQAMTVRDPHGASRKADGWVRILCPEPSIFSLFRSFEGDTSHWFIAQSEVMESISALGYPELTREEAERLIVRLLR